MESKTKGRDPQPYGPPVEPDPEDDPSFDAPNVDPEIESDSPGLG